MRLSQSATMLSSASLRKRYWCCTCRPRILSPLQISSNRQLYEVPTTATMVQSSKCRITFQEVAEDSSKRPPLPRSGAALAPLPPGHADQALLFGGYVEEEDKQRCATNDAYIFNDQSQAWRPASFASGQVPQARLVSQLVLVGQSLYLLAGWDPKTPGTGGEILSDIWRLDLGSNTWDRVEPQGMVLPQISRFQAVAHGQQILIHTHRSLSDILILDTSTQPPTLRKQAVISANSSAGTITGAQASAPGPPSRGLHSATLVGDRMFVFGGAPQSGPMLGDLWSLDLTTFAWRKHSPKGKLPAARSSHLAGAAANRYLWILGGAYHKSEGGLQMLGDVAVYDAQEDTWVETEVCGTSPSARNAAVSVPLPDGSFLLHAGWKAFDETYNDTHVMRVDVVA